MEKENLLRLLTFGEKNLAQTVFGNSIQWGKVWLHCQSFLPFGLQGKFSAMTVNGEIYLRRTTYCDDFSLSSVSRQHFFMHEMARVWQYQQGMDMPGRGLLNRVLTERYMISPDKKLSNYNSKQQAKIVADYFLLKTYGLAALKHEIGRQAGFKGIPRNIFNTVYRDKTGRCRS